jgi:DNA mismatch repair protein MutL
MGIINRLPASVINQIAAGEVIERPASAVKELLENAIDAGATRIDVAVERGGKDLIRIADDGKGIDPDDLPVAFEPHATSKLKDADDLARIATLGFRGEALAALAEISRTRCQSRPRDAETGAEITIEGGVAGPVRECGCPTGTVIEVRNLFFNTPVRRAFLRSDSTEAGHVAETFARVALAHPSIRFTFRSGGKLVHDLPAVAGIRERISVFHGRELADSLLWVESDFGPCRLWGYVCHPTQSRTSNKSQYLFIGGRYVRDRSLSHALAEAYRGLLMTGRVPVAYLFLEIPPDEIDVNVHPTKMEVRFKDGQSIYSHMLAAIRRTFLASDLHAKLQPPDEKTFRKMREEAAANAQANAGYVAPSYGGSAMGYGSPVEPRVVPVDDRPLDEPLSRDQVNTWFKAPAPAAPRLPSPDAGPFGARPEPSWAKSLPPAGAIDPAVDFDEFAPAAPRSNANFDARLSGSIERGEFDIGASSPRESSAVRDESESFGPIVDDGDRSRTRDDERRLLVADRDESIRAIQLHDSYLVAETSEGMVVIDQHALHERILYEELRGRIERGGIESQRLLVPEPVELSASDAALVMERSEALGRLGIEIEPFGGDTLLIQSVPAMLPNVDPGRLLRDLVDLFRAKPLPPTRDAVLEEILSMIACKAAVKAGNPLSAPEIEALLKRRHLAADSHHCPHGRPTALVFTRSELERQFGRT